MVGNQKVLLLFYTRGHDNNIIIIHAQYCVLCVYNIKCMPLLNAALLPIRTAHRILSTQLKTYRLYLSGCFILSLIGHNIESDRVLLTCGNAGNNVTGISSERASPRLTH